MTGTKNSRRGEPRHVVSLSIVDPPAPHGGVISAGSVIFIIPNDVEFGPNDGNGNALRFSTDSSTRRQ
jgi:hypothetical protein